MAPPIDEKRGCGTPAQNELSHLLSEAQQSPWVGMVDGELTLLEAHVNNPETVADVEAFRLAKENLKDMIESDHPTPGYRVLAVQGNGLQSCTEANTVYRDTNTPRPPVTRCDDCEFTGAYPPSDEIFDPTKIKNTIDTLIFQNLFTGLLVHNGFQPFEFGLAEGYEVSPDGLIYRIHLRQGVHWSDGQAITAEDLLYAIKQHLMPDKASLHAAELFPVQNARAFFTGGLRDFNQVGAHALDRHTVEIQLAAPSPLFPYALAGMALTPLPKHAIEQDPNFWQDPKHTNLVVSGAYQVFDYQYRDHLTLSFNPSYFRADQVQFGRVQIRHIDDPATGYDWFKLGEVQYAMQVPIPMVDQLRGSGELKVADKLCLYMYVMNTRSLNATQRRALAMAPDRETLVRQVLKLGQKSATNFVPHALWEMLGESPNRYASLLPYDFDKSKTRQMQEGDPINKELRTVYDKSSAHEAIATFLQRQMDERGIPFRIEAMEQKSMLDARNKGEYDLLRLGWCADYPDPYDFLRIFKTGDENNFGSYNNPAFDAKIEAAAVESDPERRLQELHEAEKILAKDPPAIPLYFYVNAYLLKQGIKGLEPDWSGGFLFERLRSNN